MALTVRWAWLIIAGLCAGTGAWPLRAAPAMVPVSVAVVERAAVQETVPLPATVVARRHARLSSEVDGLVATVRVEEGDSVRRGDLLVRLDSTLAQFEARIAAAQLKEGRARYREALRRRDEAARLVGKNYVAETDYRNRIAEAEIEAAAIERLQAESERRSERVERHRIRAPFDGVIAEKRVEVGEWAESGSVLLELVEIDRLRIEVPVPQRYFRRITRGSPVTLHFDALPGLALDAVVSRTIPVADPAARTFPVHIDIDNGQRRMAPGMSARVDFRLKPDPAGTALMVPRDAIVRLPDGTQRVWRIRPDDGVLRVEPVAVESGRSVGALVEIVSGGLRAGERIVVRGNERLQPGQAVRVAGGDRGHVSRSTVTTGEMAPLVETIEDTAGGREE